LGPGLFDIWVGHSTVAQVPLFTQQVGASSETVQMAALHLIFAAFFAKTIEEGHVRVKQLP